MASTSQDPKIRSIRIKTGVVRRLSKERDMYLKEVVDQEAKVQKMKDESKDEYDIKKQMEVLQESRTMIPDTERKLAAAIDELTQLLEEAESDFSDNEAYKTAKELLKTVKV